MIATSRAVDKRLYTRGAHLFTTGNRTKLEVDLRKSRSRARASEAPCLSPLASPATIIIDWFDEFDLGARVLLWSGSLHLLWGFELLVKRFG